MIRWTSDEERSIARWQEIASRILAGAVLAGAVYVVWWLVVMF